MVNLTKIKKTTTMLALSVMFAATAFAQSSSASSIGAKPISETLRPIQNYTLGVTDNSTYTDSLDVTKLKNLKKTERDTLISFLQFDISYPSTTTITSAYLSLIGSGVGNNANGSGSVSLYQVADEWINSVNQSAINALRAGSTGSLLTTENVFSEGEYFNAYNLANHLTPSSSHLSLVLLGDEYTNASFYSYLADDLSTHDNGAKLQVNGFAPVPEPSSIVLGLMSLGSLLGFRRKNRV